MPTNLKGRTSLTRVKEMRNHIYDQTLVESGVAVDGLMHSFKFLPLAQVCQQIRQEYRPIYIRDHCKRWYLPFHRVVPCLDALHPGWNDPNVNTSDVALDIEVSDLIGLLFDKFPYLDLLRLRAEAPRFRLSVELHGMDEGDWQHEARQINHMFECRDAWAKLFADGALADVKFWSDGAGQLDIVVVMAKNFTAPWLQYSDSTLVKIGYHDALAFLKSLGFKQPERYSKARSTVSLGLQDGRKSVPFQIIGPRRNINNRNSIECLWDAGEHFNFWLRTRFDD
jgi:hypothetical protein